MASRILGTEALTVIADDEIGEPEGVTILGRLGEISEDFAVSPQGG